jgi:hypothetical protein
MSGTVAINLPRAVGSVEVSGARFGRVESGLSGRDGISCRGEREQAELMQDLERQKAILGGLCQTLGGIVDKVNRFYGQDDGRD